MGRHRRFSRLFSVAIRRRHLQIFLPVLIRIRRLPIFRILLKHLGMMFCRGVMEIHLHGGRSPQHRDAVSCGLFIPPVVGALALVGGIVLLVVNPKRV